MLSTRTVKRIRELALEALLTRRAAITAEIESLQEKLAGAAGTRSVKLTTPPPGKRKPRSVAERKAQSKRMKAYWAARKSRSGKTPSDVKPVPASPKRRSKTAAEKKALSKAMKLAWAKRKAAEAKKGK
jgi:hypothetical protein